MKKIIIFIISLIVISAMLFKIIGITEPKKQQPYSGVVYAVTNIQTKLDKTTNLTKSEEDLICATSRGLIKKDSSSNIVPDLAESYEVKSEGIEYEFKIKDNIYWSDGTKITVKDICKFFKELLMYEDEASIEPIINVFGASDFRKGIGTFENNVAIIPTEKSIIIRLNKKNDKFLDELSKPQYRLRRNLKLWAKIDENYNEIIYSGQYYIKDFEDNKLELSKNRKCEGNIDDIAIIKYDSTELAMAAYEVNKVDMLIDPPSNQLERLKTNNELINFQTSEGMFMIMSSKKDATPQKRRELCKDFYKAVGEYELINSSRVQAAEGSYFLEDKNDLTKLQTRKVSINQSEPFKDFEKITLLAEENEDNRDFCEFLKDWYKTNFNIEFKYTLVKQNEIRDAKLENNYDIMLQNYVSDSKDKRSFYSQIEDELSEQAKAVLLKNDQNINSNYADLEEEIFNEYKVVPLLFFNKNIAISDKISNIAIDKNGNIDFTTITK